MRRVVEMGSGSRAKRRLAAGAMLVGLGLAAHGASAAGLASEWSEGFNSRTRLSVARLEAQETPRLYAFVEVELPAGWKTYWKAPGDSGVPPDFDWSKSRNVARAEVLYPAPKRMTDKGGEVVGYKEHVTFPVLISPDKTDEPVALDLTFQFGICKDICVPTEVSLALDVPSTGEVGDSEAALAALDTVPRPQSELRAGDPVLKSAEAQLSEGAPKLVIEAQFPGGAEAADLFLDAPGGAYIPPARKISAAGDLLTFEVDLSKDVDLEALKGQEIGLTLVGVDGQSAGALKID